MKGIRLSGVSLSGMVVLFLVCLASWTEPSLAKDQLVATAPSGIPSGRIAFVSDRDGNYEIYVMSSDGSDQRRLTYNTAGDDNSPAWSPDGTKIAFVRGYGQGSIELRVMDSELGDPDNGSSALLWSDSRGVGYPRWSPDGSKVLFTANQDEYWVASDGSGTALQLTQSGGSDSWADWSPDGKTIAFASTGDLYGDCAQTYLYLMDADGENARPILDGAGERILGGCNGLRWWPDGSEILFMRVYGPGPYGMYTVTPDGTDLRLLYSFEAFLGGFSPGGSWITYSSVGPPVGREVYVIASDGMGTAVNISNSPGADGVPSWWVKSNTIYLPLVFQGVAFN